MLKVQNTNTFSKAISFHHALQRTEGTGFTKTKLPNNEQKCYKLLVKEK